MKKILQFHYLIVPIISAMMLAVLWNVWAPTALYANGTCQGQHNNYVGTGTDSVVAVVAVSVDLNSREPAICNTSASWSGSAVWTSIVSTTNCGWSQAGYLKKPGLSIKVYGEYNKSSCSVFQPPNYMLVIWGTGQAGVHTYQVKYNSNKHLAKMWYENNVITTTPFDPGAQWGAQPWDREWNGETHDPGDDMPGSAASPAFFTNLLYQNCQTCSWLDPGIPATTNTRPDLYGLQQDAGSSFHIWTK